MRNHLNDSERATVLKVLNKHLGKYYPLEVILFGSMAGGQPRPTSDIDIAIKASAPLDKAKWAKIESDFEESLMLRDVDVVDYHRVTPEFQKVIDSQGETIIASKAHPFRLCPIGHHWVETHLREVPPSKFNPAGGLTEVDGHCRKNRGKSIKKNQDAFLEILTTDEIREMYKRFGKRKKSSLPLFTDNKKEEWNRMDDKILFWTEFWNSIYKPEEPLDPMIVKALIGSESSFNLKPKKQNAGKAGRALGLIQITDEARALLSKQNPEISNYIIELTESDLSDEDAAIAAGIRWLFHKKKLATATLKRESTWEEAIINYKGYLKDYKKNPKIYMEGLDRYHELLKELRP